MSSHSPIAIANEFLRRAGDGARLSSMQLQKLVYVAHGWCLAIKGEPLVSGRLEAWDNGPVFPELYTSTRYLPRSREGLLVDKGGEVVTASGSLDDVEIELLDAVRDRYGHLSAEVPSDMTHEPGTPWTTTYLERGRDAPIPEGLIERHYLELGRAARER